MVAVSVHSVIKFVSGRNQVWEWAQDPKHLVNVSASSRLSHHLPLTLAFALIACLYVCCFLPRNAGVGLYLALILPILLTLAVDATQVIRVFFSKPLSSGHSCLHRASSVENNSRSCRRHRKPLFDQQGTRLSRQLRLVRANIIE